MGRLKQIHSVGLLLAAIFAGGLLVLPSPELPGGWAGAPLRQAVSLASDDRPDTGAYEGLGTWVDVYDVPHLASSLSFAKMRMTGARTIYLETAHPGSPRVANRRLVDRLVERAHGAGIRVVAWTVPGHTDQRNDRRKALAAIRFKSRHGERFDGFALDIESTSVRDLDKRNRRMLALSRWIDNHAGDMPLGAITYPPLTIDNPWARFPWKRLAGIYDVFLPMAYATYRHDSERGVRDYTVKNIEMLRGKTGGNRPIHMIGGLANGMRPSATRGFVDAVQSTDIAGASLYDFRITDWDDWYELQELL